MTIEACREYSATKIMGWGTRTKSRHYWVWDEAHHRKNPTVPMSDWRPDQDRNQGAMLLQKIGIDSPVTKQADWLCDGNGYGGLFECCMTHPAKALEYIVQAHREVQSSG